MWLFAKTTARIWGSPNAWSLAPAKGGPPPWRDSDVSLEIRGNPRDGFHLVIRPDGFFATDYGYASQQEAISGAKQLFDLPEHRWTKKTCS